MGNRLLNRVTLPQSYNNTHAITTDTRNLASNASNSTPSTAASTADKHHTHHDGEHDRVLMRGLKLYGYHGWFEYERAQGQHFVLDLTFETNFAQARENDELEQTVDYMKVYALLQKYFQPHCCYKLLENLCEDISNDCFQEFHIVQSIEIRCKKSEIPLEHEYEYFGIEIKRTRKQYEFRAKRKEHDSTKSSTTSTE